MVKRNRDLYFDLDFDGLMKELSQELEKDAKKIRDDAPDRTGKYMKGWKMIMDSKNGTLSIVHDKKYRPLEHLLEFGHKLNKNGNKTISNKTYKSGAKLAINKDFKMIKVKPKPHIIENLDEAEAAIDKIIKNIDPFKYK